MFLLLTDAAYLGVKGIYYLGYYSSYGLYNAVSYMIYGKQERNIDAEIDSLKKQIEDLEKQKET